MNPIMETEFRLAKHLRKVLHLDLERKMEWISVKDRLPEKDEYVLLYDSSLDLVYEGKLLPSDFYYSDRSGYSKDLGDGCEITSWMPLPQPPKE